MYKIKLTILDNSIIITETPLPHIAKIIQESVEYEIRKHVYVGNFKVEILETSKDDKNRCIECGKKLKNSDESHNVCNNCQD